MAYLAFPTCFFLNTFTNQHKWMSLHFSSFRIEVCFFLNYFSPNRSMVCGVCLCVWVRFKFMVQLYVMQERIIALNTLAFVRLSKYMHNGYNMRSLKVLKYGVFSFSHVFLSRHIYEPVQMNVSALQFILDWSLLFFELFFRLIDRWSVVFVFASESGSSLWYNYMWYREESSLWIP